MGYVRDGSIARPDNQVLHPLSPHGQNQIESRTSILTVIVSATGRIMSIMRGTGTYGHLGDEKCHRRGCCQADDDGSPFQGYSDLTTAFNGKNGHNHFSLASERDTRIHRNNSLSPKPPPPGPAIKYLLVLQWMPPCPPVSGRMYAG